MKIGIIGGNGFIGSYFLSAYKNSFESIKILARGKRKSNSPNLVQIEGTLSNIEAIDELTQGIDVLIHTGFDHSYSENITGIYNIINSLKKNNVPRLVYISSFVVYDLLNKSILNEKSPKSKLRDIYTVEKQKIESILKENSLSFQTIVLQPSIVYGIKGNWSNVFFKGGQSKEISLPDSGKLIAPIVYVEDVAMAIHLSTIISSSKFPSRYEAFIISNDKPYQWQELYTSHQNLLKLLGKSYTEFQITDSYKGKLGNSFLKNTVITILFSNFGHLFFNGILKRLKKYIKPKINQSEVLNNPALHEHFALNGVPKLIHFFQAPIDNQKAKEILGFSPAITLDKSIESMAKYYQDSLS